MLLRSDSARTLIALVVTAALSAACTRSPSRTRHTVTDVAAPEVAAPPASELPAGRETALGEDAGARQARRADAETKAVVYRPVTPASARVLQMLLNGAVEKNKGFGGGVLRLESNGTGLMWEGASGFAVHGRPRRMEAQDTFEVASITKTFTATVVLQLMEEGRLDLDAALGDYLPESIVRGLSVVKSEDYGARLTIRQLLNHTSGLPDYWTDRPHVNRDTNAFLRDFLSDPNRSWEPEQILTYVRKLTPFGRPGVAFHYCDTGYVLLGLVIEHLTNMPLHQVLRARIFVPLHMEDTYFSYREPPASSLFESHRYEDAQDLFGQKRQSADWASGGLVSSTRDLARFMGALSRGAVFREGKTLEAMLQYVPTKDKEIDYGLGVFHITIEGRRDAKSGNVGPKAQLFGHDGHGNSFMYFCPETGILAVGTLNQTSNDWWPMVRNALKVMEAERAAISPARDQSP